MYLSPHLFRFLLNIFGPYLGAGIRVDHISPDWYSIRVSMKLRWYNRNAVRVHFGGSLYSIADPHLMLMHMQLLGRDYIIWDKSASIRFIRPGKGTVRAEFRLTPENIESIRNGTANGQICTPVYTIVIKDERSKTVAEVSKELYIRRKARG